MRDIFDALFHPESRGTLARLLMRAVWRGFRRVARRPRLFSLAGPLGLIAVIGSWAAMLALGWALLIWPHMPESFRYEPGGGGDGFFDALNYSLVSLTTLGSGDADPTDAWLKVLLPLEALLGFGLLSASISWLLLIYPVFTRRRSPAYEISLLRQAEDEGDLALDQLEPAALERIYSELTSRLIAVERDLVNFPVTYYFAEDDERFSLPAVAPYMLELARRGADDDRPSVVRLRARLLLQTIDNLARTAAQRFHRAPGDSTDDRLEAYARDHLRGGSKARS